MRYFFKGQPVLDAEFISGWKTRVEVIDPLIDSLDSLSKLRSASMEAIENYLDNISDFVSSIIFSMAI